MTLPNTEQTFPEWYEPLSEEHKNFYADMGIELACKMHGKVCGMQRFIFTVGILVGCDETGYEHRYCYGSSPEAYIGYAEWLKSGEPEPKNYIKRKG